MNIRYIALAFTLFILGVIYLANTQANIFAFVNMIPLGDKWGHFILIGTLSFLVNLAVWQNGRAQGRWGIVKVSAIVTLFVALEEISQIWLPNRTFSLLDLTFDLLGIITFGAIAHYLTRHGRLAQQKPERV